VTDALLEFLNAGAEREEREAEFASRLAENQQRVFRIAYGVLGNSADAEEVAQEAFLRAYQKSSLLRDPEKFRAWINRIGFHLALNRLRLSRRQMVRDHAWNATSPESIDGQRNAEDRLMLERMRAEINKLPRQLRDVLLLSIVDEMDASDVGAALKIPAGTVRSRLHTARKLLLKAMR
jgi:RNA polymerase sigma-70 factor (ECF subfamily)